MGIETNASEGNNLEVDARSKPEEIIQDIKSKESQDPKYFDNGLHMGSLDRLILTYSNLKEYKNALKYAKKRLLLAEKYLSTDDEEQSYLNRAREEINRLESLAKR